MRVTNLDEEELEETQTFFRKTLACPKCGKELTILRMAVSPKGVILFNVICAVCGNDGEATVDMDKLREWAITLSGIIVYVPDNPDTVQ